jgi:hypothetical protein
MARGNSFAAYSIKKIFFCHHKDKNSRAITISQVITSLTSYLNQGCGSGFGYGLDPDPGARKIKKF